MPAWIAFSVVRLLEEHFARQIDYEFTARMEDVLDEIAAGQSDRNSELAEFYFGSDTVDGLHTLVTELGEIDAKELATFPVGGPDSGIVLRVGRYGPYLEGPDDEGNPTGKRANVPDDLPPDELTLEKARELFANPAGEEIVLGQHPDTGLTVVAKNGRYGPYVTEVLPEDAEEGSDRPRTGSLFKSMSLDTITLDDAVKLLSLPRVVGHDAEGVEITAQNGRYGPYLKKGTDSRTIASEEQLLTITLDEALAIYAQPKQRGRGAATAPLKELGNDPVSGQPVVVKAGRFGEYVTDGEYNATLRKDDSVESITLERAAELLAERRETRPGQEDGQARRQEGTPRRRRPRRPPRRPSSLVEPGEPLSEPASRPRSGHRVSTPRFGGRAGERRDRRTSRARPPSALSAPPGSVGRTMSVYSSVGVFVCFEGGDGSGKSTQSQALADWLESEGYAVRLTFEPGDTEVGGRVRQIVLDPATGELSDRTESLLYAADKAEHVHSVVQPGARPGRGGDHRPLRRLDAGLPGRRPAARARRGRARRPLGHPRPAAAPDRRARPRARPRPRPVRRARPDRGRVGRVPRAGAAGLPRPRRRRPRPLPRARRPAAGRRDRRGRRRAGDAPPVAGQEDMTATPFESSLRSGSAWAPRKDRLGRPGRPGPRDRGDAGRRRAGHGMSHAWLFTGPPGSGRSNAAVALAAALQCERGGCDECHACHTVQAGTHADVTLVRTEKLSIGVDEVRDLVRRAALAPVGRRWQIMIVEDADRLTDQACNALLKAIEEPTDRTVWMLCAPTVEDVLPTIRSRCRLVTLATPTADDVAAFLVRRDGVDDGLAAYAARASQGHIGRARALARDEATRNRRREVVTIPARLTSLGACMTAAANLAEVTKEEADLITGASTSARRPTSTRPTAWSSAAAAPATTLRPSPRSSGPRRPGPSAASSTWSTAA